MICRIIFYFRNVQPETLSLCLRTFEMWAIKRLIYFEFVTELQIVSAKKLESKEMAKKFLVKNHFQNSQQLVKQFRHSCDHPGSFRLDLPRVFLTVSSWPNRLEPEILVQCLSFTNERLV